VKCLLFVLLFSLCAIAQGQTFSVGIGKTFGNTQGSGTWWQKEYAGGIDHDANSAMVRVDSKASNGWSVGGGYAYIGNFNSDALAVASDWAYEQKKPYPLSRWIGNQHMDTLFLVGRYTQGNWYVEAGPAFQRNSFTMFIPDWVPCVDNRPAACVIPDTPRPLTVGDALHGEWTIVIGAGYKFNKNWTIQFTEYPTYIRGAGGPGLLQMFSGNISLLYTIGGEK
jgi:hypothetical protein